jgi:ethanolamine utilization protein EutL
MKTLVSLRPKLLTCRLLARADAGVIAGLGGDPTRHTALGFVTCDQDDSLYAALDHATKHAPVEVIYAKSFYAGASHASGPLSGEVMGVLAGADPDEVAEGLAALRRALADDICFFAQAGPDGRTPTGPAFFPHVIPQVGRYLAGLSGLPVDSALAYLIAPPVEAMIGLDAALKTAGVRTVRFFGPPTETNFAGAYLTGALPDVEAAAQAFTEAVLDVAAFPLAAAVRPAHERR